MEWNAKSPLHWDWDNLVVFSAKPTEFSGNNCNEAGSPCSFGGDFACGSGRPGFGSDLKRESSLKSSKSTSVDSSSIVKTPDFTIETFEGTPGDCRGKKEMARTNLLSGSSLVIEASVGSDEQLIGLKLGKRTYFGNSSDGSNNKASFNMVPVSSESTTKRSRSSYQSMQFPRCQVEGCYLDLSSAKDYHRKHRICENHAKCPRVIVNGLELRFCQQCSRFHSLPEFDEKKRSCRKRLSDHNARRRKPRQEANHFSAARVSSSFYDRRQQMGFITDQFPFHDTNSTADNTLDCNFARTKQYMVIPKEIGGASKLHSTSNVLPSAVETLSKSSNMYVSAKGVTTKILNEDLEESTLSSNMVAAQDLHRALSLLSTNSWASSHPNPMRMNHATSTNSIAHTQPHVETQAFSLACPEFWEIDQHSSDSQSHMLNSQTNESSHFQENQLLKTPFLAGYDNGRYI